MNYTLAILTHGDARTLRRSIESFSEHVRPRPDIVCVFGDAITAATWDNVVALVTEEFRPAIFRFESTMPDQQAGFCAATTRLWNRACFEKPHHVFWLEHDFVFMRDVDLNHLEEVLHYQPLLAQMALIRDACNSDEVRAGGLVASRPGEFEQRETDGHRWMQQRSYFTTNPSLMRSAFMAVNRFPDDGEPYCEGRFGAALRELGYTFGAWGEGGEWVAHMGVRDGSGVGY